MSETKSVTLVRDWNGYRRGAILPIVPRGQAKVMVQRGVARWSSESEAEDMRNAKLCENLPVETEDDNPNPPPEPVAKKTKATRKKKVTKKASG